jgi:hypothetical protein
MSWMTSARFLGAQISVSEFGVRQFVLEKVLALAAVASHAEVLMMTIFIRAGTKAENPECIQLQPDSAPASVRDCHQTWMSASNC